MTPARGALRLLRAGVLGTCCLFLALTGHVLAGGTVPGPLALTVLAVPVTCLAVLMTSERLGPYRIGLTLAVTQVGLHEAFMVLAQPHCAAAMPAHGHGMVATPATCAPGMHMAAASPSMVLSHLVAAAATALLLWHGERLLWAMLSRLAITPPYGAVTTPATTMGRPSLPGVRRAARGRERIGGVGRRGPPVLAAA